jgi:hypothetical protein
MALANYYDMNRDLDSRKRLKEAEQLLRSCRLMLYAWKGSRDPSWGEHTELLETIKEVEQFLK